MKTLASLSFCVGFVLFVLPHSTIGDPAESYIGVGDNSQTAKESPLDPQDEFHIQVLLRSLIIETKERDAPSLEMAVKASSFWEIVLAILHLFGISNEQIISVLQFIADGVISILSKLPPEDVMAVEYAAGDILEMLQTGIIDWERLQSDLMIIYTIMWPYVDPELQPIITQLFDLLILLWRLINGFSPSVEPQAVSGLGDILRNVAVH